jgi:UbiD family decarboxylase
MYDDLREFIKKAEEIGEYKLIENADWNLEIGRIAELGISFPNSPLLLFDKIKGYPPGYRVVANVLTSYNRLALVCGVPMNLRGLDQVRAYRKKIKEYKPVPPVYIKTGPVKENVIVGKDIDLFKFPTPKWHEFDGGRYIGTGVSVMQKDPDNGWVNMGTYRTQIIEKDLVGFHVVTGHHGGIIAKKYWDKGKSCPIAVICGEGPQLFVASVSPVPINVSELDYAGWMKGGPVEVVKGETVDLPIPAKAEIVLEGELFPPEIEPVMEGPFGEWEGYYSGIKCPHPRVKVTAILHRNNPIILGVPPLVGNNDDYSFATFEHSAHLWDELDKQIPGVKGVYFVPAARRRPMICVSLKQMYPGHAKQAGLLISGLYQGAMYVGRWIIIVDEDIDPTNITEVLWALGTRCDPKTQIDILSDRLTMASDPRLEPEKRAIGDLTISTAIVNACRPYSWFDRFPRSIKSSPEILEQVRQKWGAAIFGDK